MAGVNETKCARPGCGHPEWAHFDDSDGMVTDGSCQQGRYSGVRCDCPGFLAPETGKTGSNEG